MASKVRTWQRADQCAAAIDAREEAEARAQMEIEAARAIKAGRMAVPNRTALVWLLPETMNGTGVPLPGGWFDLDDWLSLMAEGRIVAAPVGDLVNLDEPAPEVTVLEPDVVLDLDSWGGNVTLGFRGFDRRDLESLDW